MLAEVGGLEIAALAGFIIGGAAAGVPVIIDGVIAAAAAVVAVALSPRHPLPSRRRPPLGRARRLGGPRSPRPRAAARPRPAPGRGHGRRAWPCPCSQASAHLLAEMATFDSAGVTDKPADG